MIEGISIETFKGDYEGLERMAHASWRDEYGEASFPNFYRPAFLRYLFDRIPAAKKDHLVAAYKGGEIIAFLANLPQRFDLRGSVYNAIYSCLLVVRKEYLRRGIALDLIRTAVEANKRYGYDFSLLTLETGHRSTLMMDKLRAEGNRIERIRKSGVMARILDLGRVDASEDLKGYEKAAIRLIGAHRPPKAAPAVALREYRASDLDACHDLLDRYRKTVALARVCAKGELAPEFEYPDVARTLVWEKDGRVQAMINFILHDHLGKKVERWAWINHVAFPDLSPAERVAFLRAYLNAIKAAGCIGTIDFTKRGWPAGPFYRARFIPYPRAVKLVSWTFNPSISLAAIPVVYEIQV
ncbi:MAG: GNAT family N-acetyltransferase [Acidobacteria bacterium]|nr:GNAT family N-acetyltransferase [Acidobacteriota bacterium]MBE3125548.1 GNAT family N-acetyltransferase [Acidobacteriota bacterium]